MERDALSHIAHSEHPIACPFNDDSVAELLGRLDVPAGGSVLDIGCGRAEWLFRLLALRPALRATGVDRSAHAINTARTRSEELGITARIALIHADAMEYLDEAQSTDAALCIGSMHALGKVTTALQRLRALLPAHGQVLVGHGFWQQPPSQDALDALDVTADSFTNLAGLIDTASTAGFIPLYVLCSTEREWDQYEWSWCSALEHHALACQDTADAEEIIDVARRHRHGYLHGYRGYLGFAGMVLRATGRA